MKGSITYATEADLVSAFCLRLSTDFDGRKLKESRWTVYHETADFDLLLVEQSSGVQVGLEAKLSLNVKVLCQALPRYRWAATGPDYRGVLVPASRVQEGLSTLAQELGIGVIALPERGYAMLNLPDENCTSAFTDGWHSWMPEQRCELPEYVPDVVGGLPAPLKLTEWKIQAIKLLILLKRRGVVGRMTFKLLRLSPSRWTSPGGWLDRGGTGYVACDRTPDLQRQHPAAWAEIEADFDKWAPMEAPPGPSAAERQAAMI